VGSDFTPRFLGLCMLLLLLLPPSPATAQKGAFATGYQCSSHDAPMQNKKPGADLARSERDLHEVHSAREVHSASDAREIADRLRNRGIHPLLIAGLISMIPIFELRGGIPVGIALFGLNPLSVYFTCVVFNLVPILPVLLLLSPIRRILEKVVPFRGLFSFLQRKAESNRELVERYEEMGLTLFVGIPLPVTGAWTGSIIAEIMGLRVMKSFLFITLGVCLAGLVVTMLTLLRLYGLIITLLILSSFSVVYVLRIRRRMRRDRAAVEHPVRAPGEEPHER
jgi:uncharacterized membrane protein